MTIMRSSKCRGETRVHRLTRERLTREDFSSGEQSFRSRWLEDWVYSRLAVFRRRVGEAPRTARQQGFIWVGFFANEAPYGYADESSNLTGEAAEVARKVLKAMGRS